MQRRGIHFVLRFLVYSSWHLFFSLPSSALVIGERCQVAFNIHLLSCRRGIIRCILVRCDSHYCFWISRRWLQSLLHSFWEQYFLRHMALKTQIFFNLYFCRIFILDNLPCKLFGKSVPVDRRNSIDVLKPELEFFGSRTVLHLRLSLLLVDWYLREEDLVISKPLCLLEVSFRGQLMVVIMSRLF